MAKTLQRLLSVAAAVASLAFPMSASAEWEQVYSLPTTYAHFITTEGVHLMSDYRDNRDGGIYYSEDGGTTWSKCGVRDYWFSNFYEADGYIFAIGAGCRVARSEDGGRSWDLLNYSLAVKDWIPKGATEETVCYGITVLDGVLYVADFSGGGVLRSDDYGETWEMTDRDTLYIYFQGETTPIMDNFYHLEAYKGKVYAFGMYSIHTYSPEDKLWTALPINSNFMGSVTIFNDLMICGRAAPNYDSSYDYLLCNDGEKWRSLNRPDTNDNNVRFLASDDKFIYSLHHGGPMYYTDDMGETWNVSSNFPGELYPLTLATDDEYIYSGVYSPLASEKRAGLWRMPKSELKSGVEGVRSDNMPSPVVSGDLLQLGRTAREAAIYTADGKRVAAASKVSQLSIKGLNRGVYIYTVDYDNRSASGKFVIK